MGSQASGEISFAGDIDTFFFIATAGQQVFFDGQNGNSSQSWRVLDEDGTVIVSTCMACGDPATKILELGGTYTIIVGSDRSNGTGTYQFQLVDQSIPVTAIPVIWFF